MQQPPTTINFELKTNIKLGKGEALNIQNHLEDYKSKKPFAIIDHAVHQTPYGKEVLDALDCNYHIYTEKEPTYQYLESIRNKVTSTTNTIIGIGGGSTIDMAKGLAFLATNNKQALSYKGFPHYVNSSLPIIAVPTTAGTGSEVTYNAVFTDKTQNKKLGINHKSNFPTLAILDSTFLTYCPTQVLLSTGLDSLVHSIESFGANQSNILTKGLSYMAFEYILQSIEGTVKKEEKYFNTLMVGSYIAGISLMNSGSGPSGALSYALGTNFNVPHGLAGAVFLPHVVALNEKRGYNYQQLLKLSLPLSEILFDLYHKLQFVPDIYQFGVTDKNVHILLEAIKTLQPAFNQNPTKFTIEDAKNIIERTMS